MSQILPEAVAQAHRAAVTLIRNDVEELTNVGVVDGEVRWNIVPLIERALAHVFDQSVLGFATDRFSFRVRHTRK